jgi:hypothetical protein
MPAWGSAMAKDKFFTLRLPYDQFDKAQFEQALRTSKHICNVLYAPDELSDYRIESKMFENVSFSKTTLKGLNFKNCVFKHCLFIATQLEKVEFHNCQFVECNFFKAEFRGVYGHPRQFAKAIRSGSYANVAVHLYQELRDNFLDEMQPEFRREAEYQFRRWKRKLYWREILAGNNLPRSILRWTGSALYGFVFGYGFRVRNLLLTTVSAILFLSLVSHANHATFFMDNGDVTLIRSLYFTVSTMVTMGAVGFTPLSDAGYAYVLLNALVGVLLITATVNSIAKRVAR